MTLFFNRFAAISTLLALLSGCASSASSGASDATTTTDSATSADSGSKADGTASADSTAGTETTAAVSIEVAGIWTTNFKTEEEITDKKWSFMLMTEFDNAKNVAYTQNAADDKYNPSKFNKIVWTEPKADVFYYCTVDFGKDTLALAKASTLTADDKDLDKKGCGGFGWTQMTKKK